MTIEVPLLRLGLAGYSEVQQSTAAEAAVAAGTAVPDGRSVPSPRPMHGGWKAAGPC